MEQERRRETHKASPSENKATHLGVLPIAGVLMGLAFGVGCERVASMRNAFRDATAHEQYAQALRDGVLGETALARDWRAAAGRALETPLTPRLPFREVGYFDPARPSAVGYRFPAQRGQELRIHVDFAPPDSARLFVDLFRGPADTTQSLTHVAGADTNGTLTVDVTRDASYLLRLQPELLRGGRYRLTIRTGASLAVFPVAGADSRAVQSVFGDPREGGAREHHGVDVFAPRGTPVLAVAEGVVGRVGDGGIGGKTVWLRDRDGRTFYYAHLDSQLVRSGKRVQPGDTLGLVGNTGNARTTPPHLHFGLYLRDPVDPYPYVHEPRTDAPPIAADTSRLGRFGRVAVARANLRGGPTTASPVQRVLPRHCPAPHGQQRQLAPRAPARRHRRLCRSLSPASRQHGTADCLLCSRPRPSPSGHDGCGHGPPGTGGCGGARTLRSVRPHRAARRPDRVGSGKERLNAAAALGTDRSPALGRSAVEHDLCITQVAGYNRFAIVTADPGRRTDCSADLPQSAVCRPLPCR